MCGYHLGSISSNSFSEQRLVEQTRWATQRLDSKTYHTLVFTSNGSFLDPHEVPDTVRPKLLQILYGAGFQFVVVETRLEFVNTERLDSILAAIPPLNRGKNNNGQPLSISFGLESQSDFILSTCINKGTNRRAIEEKAGLIRAKGFPIDCYILLGKPFLSAQEDVQDALLSIRMARELGADYIFVMVTNQVDHSLVSHLICQGRQPLPSLWRAVYLLETLPSELRQFVQIKGINHAPYPPKEYATTCPACRERIVLGLNFWNQTGDFEHIRELPKCFCRKRFETEELENAPSFSLPERVHTAYAQLAQELDININLVPSLAELSKMWQDENP